MSCSNKHYYGGTTTYTVTLDFGSSSARPFGKGLSVSDVLPFTISVEEDEQGETEKDY